MEEVKKDFEQIGKLLKKLVESARESDFERVGYLRQHITEIIEKNTKETQ